MAKFKVQFTESMAEVMESWGWKFLGVDFGLDPQWYKYENATLIASFGGGTWTRDLAAARMETMRENEAMVTYNWELSKPVIDLLKSMGWIWAMAGKDTGEWLKFSPDGMGLACQWDQCWIDDVENAKALAGEGVLPTAWEPTLELRYQLHQTLPSPVLQQKWVRVSCGSSEWRDVEYVDSMGAPLV